MNFRKTQLLLVTPIKKLSKEYVAMLVDVFSDRIWLVSILKLAKDTYCCSNWYDVDDTCINDIITWNPSHWQFFHYILHSMEISFCWHSTHDTVITTTFCRCDRLLWRHPHKLHHKKKSSQFELCFKYRWWNGPLPQIALILTQHFKMSSVGWPVAMC